MAELVGAGADCAQAAAANGNSSAAATLGMRRAHAITALYFHAMDTVLSALHFMLLGTHATLRVTLFACGEIGRNTLAN
ncbi:MAG: hypothetical protein QM803_06500 [Rhodocyclaceae bacterium]